MVFSFLLSGHTYKDSYINGTCILARPKVNLGCSISKMTEKNSYTMLSGVLLLLTMCVSGHAAWLEALSQPVITALLSGHNQLRSSLNLPDLVWDSKLVSVAESHVHDCFIAFGANNAIAYGISTKSTDSVALVNEAIAWWSSEVNYVDPKWACIAVWMCRAYSQLVWKKTTSVGCAIYHCSTYEDVLLICEYDPPGNVQGEIPY